MSRRNFSRPSRRCLREGRFSRRGVSRRHPPRRSRGALSTFCCEACTGSADGAPAYPPLAMFKIVFLQLSSRGAAFPILARRRRCATVCRFAASAVFHSSIWRLRRRIGASTGSACRRNFWPRGNRQRDARGLMVKRGALVDATIIPAAVQRPPREEGQVNPRGLGASRSRTAQTHFGDTAHLAVEAAEMTSADLRDRQRRRGEDPGRRAGRFYADKA